MGCGIISPGLCTEEVVPGISVTVVDAATGKPVADSARGIVRDGEYEDSLTVYVFAADGRPTTLRGADERPGVYSVLLAHPRFELWARDRIQVNDGRCHVQMRELRAELVSLE